jgi:hypothetical protein
VLSIFSGEDNIMLMSGGSVSDVISSLFSVMLALAGCGKKTSLPLAGCGKTPAGHEFLDTDVVI